jgi:hypothetical protein
MLIVQSGYMGLWNSKIMRLIYIKCSICFDLLEAAIRGATSNVMGIGTWITSHSLIVILNAIQTSSVL